MKPRDGRGKLTLAETTIGVAIHVGAYLFFGWPILVIMGVAYSAFLVLGWAFARPEEDLL